MDNAQIDAFILSHLPATFRELVDASKQHFGVSTFRAIDRRLQSLRKRSVIGFSRDSGPAPVWNTLTKEPE